MKSVLTQKRLKELLTYDQWTGVFTWKVSRGSAKNGKIAGSEDSLGYSQITICCKRYLSHRLAWLYVHGYFPEKDVDHIDRVRNHNWISNLREASRQCNLRNTGNVKDNTSGVKGVCWAKNDKRWIAQIAIMGDTKYLGSYKEFSEAVFARLAGEQCLNWEGCDSSSPAFKYVRKMIGQL